MRLTRLGNRVLSRLTGFELIHARNRSRLLKQSQQYKSIKNQHINLTKSLSSLKHDYELLTKDCNELLSSNKKLTQKNRQLTNLCNSHKRTMSIIGNFADNNPNESVDNFINILEFSKSQIGQDIFVVSQLGLRPGFFVEFGAADGITLSNTHLLESKLGWQGILAEPARCDADNLAKNRTAKIDYRCVWKESGHKLKFVEAKYSALSTLALYSNDDFHAKQREAPEDTYDVETVSLTDLLDQHNAPRDIDYLSIDTEGSELDIISTFDFKKYNISIITCEHNYTESRQKIRQTLKKNGYCHVLEGFSEVDDWFVRR